MRHAEPTGRWRHRAEQSWLRRERLVLQIEERGLLTTFIAGHQDTQWVTRWRDAKATDMPNHLAFALRDVATVSP